MTSNKHITEHILSLVLYALAEADKNDMKDMVSILDDALLRIIAEHEKLHGSEQTWEKCTELYQSILQSVDDQQSLRNIPTLSDLEK